MGKKCKRLFSSNPQNKTIKNIKKSWHYKHIKRGTYFYKFHKTKSKLNKQELIHVLKTVNCNFRYIPDKLQYKDVKGLKNLKRSLTKKSNISFVHFQNSDLNKTFPNDLIRIYRDNDFTKYHTYLRYELIAWFFRLNSDMYLSQTIGNQLNEYQKLKYRLYKLPNGEWVTNGTSLFNKHVQDFMVGPGKYMYMGCNFGTSRIFCKKEKIFILHPVQKWKSLTQKQKFDCYVHYHQNSKQQII